MKWRASEWWGQGFGNHVGHYFFKICDSFWATGFSCLFAPTFNFTFHYYFLLFMIWIGLGPFFSIFSFLGPPILHFLPSFFPCPHSTLHCSIQPIQLFHIPLTTHNSTLWNTQIFLNYNFSIHLYLPSNRFIQFHYLFQYIPITKRYATSSCNHSDFDLTS